MMVYFLTQENIVIPRIDPSRWQELQRRLSIQTKPWKKHGDYILITCQRDTGWSMDGLP